MDIPHQVNVLLVDDDEALHLIYERIFEDRFGGTIHLAHCSDPVVLDAALAAEDPDIIILDQRLPNGFLGTNLIPSIRRAKPFVQIILNSAYGSEELASQAISSGVDGYVMGSKENNDILLDQVGKAKEKVEGNAMLEGMGDELRRAIKSQTFADRISSIKEKLGASHEA